jgi:hypothetical protein
VSDDLTDAEIRDRYATAARVIGLHLREFCDDSLPYDQMISDAARKCAAALAVERQAREQAEQELAAMRVERDIWKQSSIAAEQAEQERDRLRAIVQEIADDETCDDNPSGCWGTSGPYCGAHAGGVYYDELVLKARAALAPQDGQPRQIDPVCTCPVRPCGVHDYDPPQVLDRLGDGPYLPGQAPRRRRAQDTQP